jgi:hypothetical protein
MQKHRFSTNFIVGAAMALVFTFTAQAQNTVSFVAYNGSDTNACTATAHCRSFTRALAVTDSGGEIIVVSSGSYAAATIAQPVTINAVGVVATTSETTAGLNALYINTTGNVTINGLNLIGGGTGNDGIYVNAVGILHLYNMQIQGFANNGIDFASAGGSLTLDGSTISDCGHDGLLVQGSGNRAFVHNTDFENNAFAGADNVTGYVDITDSSAQLNQYGFYADGGRVRLYNDRAMFNTNGLAVTGTSSANGAGNMYFAACLLSDNTNSYNIGSGGVLSGSSPGTTMIPPGQGTVGTLSAAQTLQ